MFVFQAKSVSILFQIGSCTEINSLTKPQNFFLANNISVHSYKILLLTPTLFLYITEGDTCSHYIPVCVNPMII